MISRLTSPSDRLSRILPWIALLLTLLLALYAGQHLDIRLLVLPVAAVTCIVLLSKPEYGLLLLVIAALLVPKEFGTGTAVKLNLATLLLIGLIGLWLVRMLVVKGSGWQVQRVDIPLILFLVSGLASLVIGRLYWDPLVTIPYNFGLVQLAQWAIFALSAGSFWLTGYYVRSEESLERLAWLFITIAGAVAFISIVPSAYSLVSGYTTLAFIRAPLWMLLTAMAGGQLLFNSELTSRSRLFLISVLSATLYYGFVLNRESSSTWVGIGASLGVIVWLRFRRLRLLLIFVVVVLVLANILFPAVWQYAGGEAAWASTGGSRLALIERVVDVTMRNPITGLGPAAYRPYANSTPLPYLNAYWIDPHVNSHNNYVDLFAHVGILGLIIFAWFAWSIFRFGFELSRTNTHGFLSGYINGMLAAGAGSLVLMMFADWILPFVYNIGFPGFQASVLVWLFMGGLVSIEDIYTQGSASAAKPK